MPLVELKTNQNAKVDADKFLAAATTEISKQLGKPENLFMTVSQTGLEMKMAGSDEFTACLDISGLGLTDEHTGELTAKLCLLAKEIMKIAPERVFVRFQNYERSMWGCDGKTFA